MANTPEYQRDYRDRNPEYAAEDKRRKRARAAAQSRLVGMFPIEFHALFTEELRKSDPNQRGR